MRSWAELPQVAISLDTEGKNEHLPEELIKKCKRRISCPTYEYCWAASLKKNPNKQTKQKITALNKKRSVPNSTTATTTEGGRALLWMWLSLDTFPAHIPAVQWINVISAAHVKLFWKDEISTYWNVKIRCWTGIWIEEIEITWFPITDSDKFPWIPSQKHVSLLKSEALEPQPTSKLIKLRKLQLWSSKPKTSSNYLVFANNGHIIWKKDFFSIVNIVCLNSTNSMCSSAVANILYLILKLLKFVFKLL